MPLTPGTRLGTYEIVASLGAGGMGEVYRARDLRLLREVAVKVLPPGVASSPERQARFEREARAVAGLNHPNIVTLYSVEDEENVRFLTMELVEGQPLAALIPPDGLELRRVLELAIPLSDALVAAHEHGVIHRDLKPVNVMVTRDGRVKILDFGLAKHAAAESTDDVSQTATRSATISVAGEIVGTVPYMAPEQIRGEAVDARADVFALGILLYELASGRRPFAGATAADISSAILRDTPEPLATNRGDLPEDFERIVSRCLEKNSRERFQTALDVLNELRNLQRRVENAGEARGCSRKVASIAVLPFVNRSADTADEYFSDGLADELLNMLAKIPGLRVSARASSFHFKGKDVPIAEVARALNVATVLDGSVRKAGNRVRITVQLVKASDGYHLWSETYDRTLEDIFAVQDDIAHAVVKELRAKLLGEHEDSDASGIARAEVARAAKGRGTEPEAHRLYLLARHLIDRWTREETAKAIEYLKEALALDPKYAAAWATLGWAYMGEADQGWAPVADGFVRAKAAVERALELEPDLAEAHQAMGRMLTVNAWDWKGAEQSYARALELAPGNAVVLRGAGVLAWTQGRLEQAIHYYRRSLEQDPLSAWSYHTLGTALHAAGRFAEAEASYRKALELAPQRTATRARLALTLLAAGRPDEALAQVGLEPEEAYRHWAFAIVHHAMGNAKASNAALRELVDRWSEDSAYQIAEVCGARGESDEAFEWLECAYSQRDGGLAEAKTSPRLRTLHGDPRWRPLMRRMGFE